MADIVKATIRYHPVEGAIKLIETMQISQQEKSRVLSFDMMGRGYRLLSPFFSLA